MIELWAFLAEPQNQTTLAWLGGGLATGIGALWTAFVYLRGRRGPPPPPPEARRAEARTGIAATGDVRVGGNLTIQDRRWSPGGLAVLVLGVALLAALWQGEGCVVGVGVCNTGSIDNSTITIQQR